MCIRDRKWGEHPCAFVTLKPGESMSKNDVIQFCGNNLARFKVPKTVIFGSLEKTSTGKVQKYRLREIAENKSMVDAGKRKKNALDEAIITSAARTLLGTGYISIYAHRKYTMKSEVVKKQKEIGSLTEKLRDLQEKLEKKERKERPDEAAQ